LNNTRQADDAPTGLFNQTLVTLSSVLDQYPVAILEFKKWWGQCGTKEKAGGST